MKTIIILIVTVTISSASFAQHDFSIKPLPKIDFNSGVLQQDSSFLKFDNSRKSVDYLALVTPEIRDKKDVAVLKYKSKMPIVIPRGNYWNMPVAVTDSTINYAIREKRVELFNSYEKEKKW